ncbi:hypothetical protein WJX79_010928 [Trebouxia sp. C0005]
MYPQYPQYSYSYSASLPSGAYVPVPVYAPHQQAYYPPAYPPPPAVSAAPAAPSAHRLSIRDPSTGLLVPVVTPEQVEDAVKTYHLRSKPSDLVELDLEELFMRCQAHLPQNIAVQDSGDFASNLLLNAARKGFPFCQYYVGRCFEQGKGVVGDQSQCQQWFQKAADECIPEAMYKLAQCFEDGWGCVRDLAKAVDLYTEAAEANVAAAQLRLGVMYENGIGMRVNYKEALALFSKAQDLAEAQYHVGRCCDHGIGTTEDKTKAVHWYTKARDSGFLLAANRLREVRLAASSGLQDTSTSERALASSEKAAGSTGPPAGIPPQGSKLAGTKPDPKAKPFTPGANGLQPGDSGLSRSEFSGSVKPDPRAKPFVPPPSLAAKLLAKQGDGWGSDSGSVKSDASGASGGGTQASRMPASQPQGKGGQLKAQAQAFQPKAQMPANKRRAGEAPIIGKQPEAVVPVVPPDEPPASLKSTNKSTAPLIMEAATSSAKQKDEQKEGKVPANSPSRTLAKKLARASHSQGAAWQEIKSESGPVEDLDELHTLQMSTAWTALEQASVAFPPDINALKAAIRQARPYEELKGYVTGAESLLASGTKSKEDIDKASVVAPDDPQQTAAAVDAVTADAAPESASAAASGNQEANGPSPDGGVADEQDAAERQAEPMQEDKEEQGDKSRNPSTGAAPSPVVQTTPVKQPQPSRRAAKPYQSTTKTPVAPYRPPGTAYDPSQAEARQSGADAHAANAYNPLQAENSGYSDAGQAQPGPPEREQSSEAVLADILGGWGGLRGTPSKLGRPAANSAGASREASRSPVLSAPSGPRYQPPLSPERLQAEAPDQTGAPAGTAAGTAAGPAAGTAADAAPPPEQPVSTGKAAADKDASLRQLSAAALADELASHQQPSEANLEGQAPTSSQQDKPEDQGHTDAQTDTSRRANPEDQPQGSSQQGEEESWQEANERRKVQDPAPQQPPPSAPAPKQQSQPQWPAPPQTPSQTPQQQSHVPKQQPSVQRLAAPQPSGQGPSSQQPQPKAAASAAIPLPANSAWAKKLDLQSAASLPSSSSAAASAAAAPPVRQPSQNPQPAPAAKPSSSLSTPIVKAIPIPERPASAGAKGKGKGKTKGQAKHAPVAQPSAGASSSPGQLGSTVKEVPAKDKDSRPKASNSTVVPAPGLEKKSAAPGLQDSGPQQRDVKKEKEGAMITIMQDGMRVTASNRQAWIEICTCPLSLDIMTDPVVAADGITYERQDIQNWMDLKTVQKSPWTDEDFETKDLTPNLLVLQLIRQFNLIESGV